MLLDAYFLGNKEIERRSARGHLHSETFRFYKLAKVVTYRQLADFCLDPCIDFVEEYSYIAVNAHDEEDFYFSTGEEFDDAIEENLHLEKIYVPNVAEKDNHLFYDTRKQGMHLFHDPQE